MTTTKQRIHEGTVYACAHKVSFFYRLPPKVRIPQETLDSLTAEAEDRAKECIFGGCVQGELSYEDEKIQVNGWWRIERD